MKEAARNDSTMSLVNMATAVEESISHLVEQVCAYSIAQKSLWQQVPWLALEADGRHGYNGAYSGAYSHGFWPLHSTNMTGPGYVGYVDLATGNLVLSMTQPVRPSNARLACIACEPDLLNAQKLLDHLTTESVRPYFEHHDEQEIARITAWREELRTRFRVQKVFERKTGS